jgi:hypothetical protein
MPDRHRRLGGSPGKAQPWAEGVGPSPARRGALFGIDLHAGPPNRPRPCATSGNYSEYWSESINQYFTGGRGGKKSRHGRFGATGVVMRLVCLSVGRGRERERGDGEEKNVRPHFSITLFRLLPIPSRVLTARVVVVGGWMDGGDDSIG